MSSNKTFDPWNTYHVSLDERKAIEERKKMSDARKAEFKMKKSSPFTPPRTFIFDPAIQRLYSAKFTHEYYTRMTSKVVVSALLIMTPLFLLGHYGLKFKKSYTNMVNDGKIDIRRQRQSMPSHP